MDEHGLPITGAGVNYAAVEAINQRELVTYFNMFLVRTTAFMNNFATKCESKLATLNSRLETMDRSLTLLETKLDSVDELRNLKLEDANPAGTTAAATTTTSGSVPPPPPSDAGGAVPPAPPPPPPGGGSAAAPVPPAPAPEPEPPAVQANPVNQDPRYKKYFTMLKMGVIPDAIKLKMKAEGVIPDYLDTPDAPAPPDDGPKDDSDASDSDDSD